MFQFDFQLSVHFLFMVRIADEGEESYKAVRRAVKEYRGMVKEYYQSVGDLLQLLLYVYPYVCTSENIKCSIL